MGVTYTSTITVRCVKEHTCAACGAVFAYPFTRVVKGQGTTQAGASAKAEALSAKVAQRDVDAHPCPACGLYQPDMIGLRRARGHWWVFWLALIALGFAMIIRAAHGVQSNVATLVFTAIAAAAALAHAAIALRNPNANADANRQLAASQLATGALFHQPPPGRPPARPAGMAMATTMPAGSPLRWVGLLLLAAAVAAAYAPELLRGSGAWPLNAEAYPPVVGPGDTTRVYMPEKIQSVKSYWRGQPIVTMRSGAAGVTPLAAETNSNTWSGTIRAKSSEKNGTSTPWVRLTLPDDAALAGKTVECDILLKVEYPAASGSTYQTATKSFHRTVSLTLAPPRAGGRYNATWWQATSAATGLTLLAGIVLVAAARALQRQANPTRALVPAAPA